MPPDPPRCATSTRFATPAGSGSRCARPRNPQFPLDAVGDRDVGDRTAAVESDEIAGQFGDSGAGSVMRLDSAL